MPYWVGVNSDADRGGRPDLVPLPAAAATGLVVFLEELVVEGQSFR